MLTDIEIAQQTKLIPIDQLAHEYGLSDDQFIPYGRDKAKVALDTSNAKGKLILVTATSGMPAGSGKTTTSIAVAQAFKKLGEKACLALREPSLGPSFGMKGGAAGGGYSQVVPMESINLHFTGDFHAITAANNLLAALIDNARHQGQVDLKEITWRRVLDVNDRMLRNIVTGLGGSANGIPTETGFDITAASELMAIVCLAAGEEDLRVRLDRLVVGLKRDGSAYTCKELGATGALMALLKDAMLPNLVQSIEGVPAFVHGGPFANIAHGCNSVAATRAAMTIADWAITEAGFGSDLGAEKFYDIKCRMNNLQPAATILVTSLRALKWHGGVPLPEIKQIATTHKPNSELAAALWKEDIREFKILASFLQPVDEFSSQEAKQWVKEIPYLEIAEQCSHNLFYKLPDVEDLLLGLIFNVEDEYARTVAYLVWAELFKEGKDLIAPVRTAFVAECMRTLAQTDFEASFKEKQAAVKAMKFYGRQSAERAQQMLDGFDDFPEFMQTPEGQEIYNDLKFEFEYCR